MEFKDMLVLLALGALGAGVLFGAAVMVKKDADVWAAFAQTHECKVVSHTAGDVMVVQTGQTFGVAVGDDKTCWACNDGVTYCR